MNEKSTRSNRIYTSRSHLVILYMQAPVPTTISDFQITKQNKTKIQHIFKFGYRLRTQRRKFTLQADGQHNHALGANQYNNDKRFREGYYRKMEARKSVAAKPFASTPHQGYSRAYAYYMKNNPDHLGRNMEVRYNS